MTHGPKTDGMLSSAIDIAPTELSTYIINMKAVQVLCDEKLLALLDMDEEVRNLGRSAVVRRLISAYLESRREALIDAQYAQGYSDKKSHGGGLGQEYEGWENEGVWPTE